MHHGLALCGFGCGAIAGFSFPGLSCLSLYSEISSIFLNYNDQLKHYEDSSLMVVNKIVFFLTFTATRIFMFPWIYYHLIRTTLLFHSYVE